MGHLGRKTLGLIVVLTLLMGLLAACGGDTATTAPTAGSTGGNTAATTAPVAAAPTDAPAAAATDAPVAPPAGGEMMLPANCTNVELQYWNPFTGPDGPFMGKMVDSFNAANSNIKVTMTSQPEYYTQLSTAAAANTLPDVAIIHADQVPTQVFRNILRPIDDLIAATGVKSSDFPEAVWAAGDVAGSHYSIPLDIHPMTMFYNEDMLKAAGLTAAPTNGEEFAAAAKAMTTGDNKGFMITTGFPVQQLFQQLLHQYGGSEFDAAGTKTTWNSEAGVKALQWMLDAQKAYSEPNLEVDAELNAFKGGAVGMVWNGIWQTTNMTGEGVDFAGKATAVPQIGPNPGVWAGSHQLALTKQATIDPCKDAAAGMLIKYLSDNSVEWSKAGQIPANTTVRTSATFKAVEPQASIAPSVDGAFFPPSVPGITDAFAPLSEAVSSIMSGNETDIKAALDTAAGRADQILADNLTNYGTAPK